MDFQSSQPLYQPLPSPTSLRLLSVRRDVNGGFIEADLKVFSLEAAHELRYIPISYSWGRSDCTETVLINNFQVSILQTAFEILEAFCDLPQLKGIEWIWLDSICINQQDNAERSAQVALMTSIFGNAEVAFAWLGPENALSRRGAAFIRAMAEVEDEETHRSTFGDAQDWEGLREIASRSWWRRAWTLQESVIAKHRAIYFCGSQGFSTRDVDCVAERHHRMRPAEITFDEAVTLPMTHRRRIGLWYGAFNGHHGQDITLLALLAYSSFLEATDPRDYIYSLLGCVKDSDRELVGAADYNATIEQVYTDFAKNWITHRDSLDILSFAQIFPPNSSSSDSNHSLPSWIPDWRDRSSTRAFEIGRLNSVPLLVSQSAKLHIDGLRPFATTPSPLKPVYEAAGDRTPYIAFQNGVDGRCQLTCHGVCIDTIDGMSAMFEDVHGPQEETVLPMIQTSSPHNTPRTGWARFANPSLHHVREAVAMCLTFGRRDIFLQHVADWKQFIDPLIQTLKQSGSIDEGGIHAAHFTSWYRLNQDFVIRRRSLGAIFGSDRPPPRKTVSSQHVRDSLEKMYVATASEEWARRLAATEEGHVAMVPRHARRGDQIFVLYGCSVPMVLRRRDADTFEFVGECYVHGFMEGQAVKAAHDVQRITLV